ncbi:hypothetical protein, partial [Geobacillus stearothermophilus]|uniref:hypothetical protein n=1 Tax=Geobacillus stearothermophilus TaxID=1422 RepID=UPI001C7D35D4
TVNTACCTVNMRFTSLSINIHIIDKERRKYSAHFMMWLNSYNFVLHPVERPLHSIKMTCYEGKQNRTIGKSLLQLIYIKFNGSSPKVVLDFF